MRFKPLNQVFPEFMPKFYDLNLAQLSSNYSTKSLNNPVDQRSYIDDSQWYSSNLRHRKNKRALFFYLKNNNLQMWFFHENDIMCAYLYLYLGKSKY